MENIILGLLILQSRTIYQLRKRIDEGLNLMYSCSTGSIQAALKKLLQNGYIAVTELNEDGKMKKLYSVTDSGKQQFFSWVNAPIESQTKCPELAKIYFIGHISLENRILLIRTYIDDLREKLSILEEVCREGEHFMIEYKDNDILFYQLQTAKYGRDHMRFNIAWYEQLLKEIERKEQ